jgi:hypothetical protein
MQYVLTSAKNESKVAEAFYGGYRAAARWQESTGLTPNSTRRVEQAPRRVEQAKKAHKGAKCIVQ